MNKKGQFFIMAAFIVVGLIISTKAVYNVANSPLEETQVVDLSKEINFEAVKVIDNRVYTAKETENIYNNVGSLSQNYSASNPGVDLVFIVGNSVEFRKFEYISGSQGSTGLSSGSTSSKINIEDTPMNTGLESSTNGEYSYNLEGTDGKTITRTFKVNKGQNFYIVIKKEKEGEQIVVTN